jgi:AcrR family transcriptional regulator
MRGRILEAAGELFAVHGFLETRIVDICDRADVAQKTFFNHFPTKLDLLREVAELALSDLFRDVEDLRKRPGSFSDHIATLFEMSAEQTEAMGPQAKDLLNAMIAQGFAESAVSDDQRIRSAFRRFIEDGRAAGDLRDDVDLETLTEVVVGTWYSMFLSWVHFDDYPLKTRASSAGRFLASTCAAKQEDPK